MEVRYSNHTAYKTEYHVVWIPKYRRRILRPGVDVSLERMLKHQTKSMPGVEIVQLGIEIDHVHLVIIIPPKYRVSDVIGALKGNSASRLRKMFKWLQKVYWQENVVWSPGYFVSTVGIDEEKVLRYVKYQERVDSGQAKLVL